MRNSYIVMRKIKTLIGIVLITLGISGFAYQGIRLTRSEAEPRRMPLSPVIAVVALIGGIALLLTNDGKRDLHGRSS